MCVLPTSIAPTQPFMTEDTDTTSQLLIRTGIGYGLITTGLLIIYFLAMLLLGKISQVEWRYANAFILISGIAMAFYDLRKRRGYIGEVKFGFLLSLTTAFSTGIFFTIFLYIFLTYLRPDVAVSILDAVGTDMLNVRKMVLIILAEAFGSGVFISMLMALFMRARKLMRARQNTF